jgi:hypothetical protein
MYGINSSLNNHFCIQKMLLMFFFFWEITHPCNIQHMFEVHLGRRKTIASAPVELHSDGRRQGALCTTSSMLLTHLSGTVIGLYLLISYKIDCGIGRPNLRHSPQMKMELLTGNFKFRPAGASEYFHRRRRKPSESYLHCF